MVIITVPMNFTVTVTVPVTVKQGLCQPVKLRIGSVQHHHLQ